MIENISEIASQMDAEVNHKDFVRDYKDKRIKVVLDYRNPMLMDSKHFSEKYWIILGLVTLFLFIMIPLIFVPIVLGYSWIAYIGIMLVFIL